MRTIVCYKVARDERDMVVAPDRTVGFDRCGLVVGDYDLNAIEAGVELATASGGEVVALTAGGEEARDSKLRKSVLSRGVSGLTVVADPALTSATAEVTARVLEAAATKLGFDVLLCGEGSADRYSQQVAAQVAARLGVPFVNAVSRIEPVEGGLVVERTLEDEVETLQVPLPAVLAVTSDLNTPRVPTMKDILGAGRKPVTEYSLGDLEAALPPAVETTGPELAPASHQRSATVFEAGQQDEFFGALRRLIGKDAK